MLGLESRALDHTAAEAVIAKSLFVVAEVEASHSASSPKFFNKYLYYFCWGLRFLSDT